MRKTVAAGAAVLFLVSGEAAAAGSNNALLRVGDRIGAQANSVEQFAGIPLPILLIGAAAIAAAVLATDDASESD